MCCLFPFFFLDSDVLISCAPTMSLFLLSMKQNMKWTSLNIPWMSYVWYIQLNLQVRVYALYAFLFCILISKNYSVWFTLYCVFYSPEFCSLINLCWIKQNEGIQCKCRSVGRYIYIFMKNIYVFMGIIHPRWLIYRIKNV